MAPRRSPPVSLKQQRDVARIHRYLDLLDRYHEEQEELVANWKIRALLWVMQSALRELQRALEKGNRVRWSSPFWAFQYPVNWDWEQWRFNKCELAIQYGQLTSENTRTRKKALRALGQIHVREIIYRTLHDLTHEVSTYKDGRYQHPMVPEPVAEQIRSLPRRRLQRDRLQELFEPFSIGAANINIPVVLKKGQRIPKRLAEQLARATRTIDIPEFACPVVVDGNSLMVRIIFQVFPLTIEDRTQRAYFPITVGLTITPPEPRAENLLSPSSLIDPGRWTARGRIALWRQLFEFLDVMQRDIATERKDQLTKAVTEVSTKMEIELRSTSPETLQKSTNKLLTSLRTEGLVTGFKLSAMTPPSHAHVAAQAAAALEKIESVLNTNEKGHALEELLVILLEAVPGFEVKRRVHTLTEELDLKVLCSNADPRWRDSPLILFECKNWSKVCGKDELVLFERKLENRRSRARLGFLVSWAGFTRTVSQERLRGSRGSIQIALLTGDELRAAVKTGDILPILQDAVDRADDH